MTDPASSRMAGAPARLGDFFDEAPRVIYDKHPLSQVICQFRYPPILKIDSDLPAEFQETVRARFPLFEQVGGPFGSPFLPMAGLRPDLSNLLAAQIGAGHRFKSEDQAAIIDLNSNFVGLTVTKYTFWENFKQLAALAYKTLVKCYKPAYFSRIGLRYVNIIDRERIGATDIPWSRLLSENLYKDGLTIKYEQSIDELTKTVRLRNSDGIGGLLLNSGIIKAANSNNNFLIDFDFYVDARTEIDHAEDVLEELHRLSGRAFRWAISDELHQRLGPTAVPHGGVAAV